MGLQLDLQSQRRTQHGRLLDTCRHPVQCFHVDKTYNSCLSTDNAACDLHVSRGELLQVHVHNLVGLVTPLLLVAQLQGVVTQSAVVISIGVKRWRWCGPHLAYLQSSCTLSWPLHSHWPTSHSSSGWQGHSGHGYCYCYWLLELEKGPSQGS